MPPITGSEPRPGSRSAMPSASRSTRRGSSAARPLGRPRPLARPLANRSYLQKIETFIFERFFRRRYPTSHFRFHLTSRLSKFLQNYLLSCDLKITLKKTLGIQRRRSTAHPLRFYPAAFLDPQSFFRAFFRWWFSGMDRGTRWTSSARASPSSGGWSAPPGPCYFGGSSSDASFLRKRVGSCWSSRLCALPGQLKFPNFGENVW